MRIKDAIRVHAPEDMQRTLVLYPTTFHSDSLECDAEDYSDLSFDHHSNKMFGYIMGYINAANRILGSWQGRSVSSVDDDTAYPVLFLIRHSVELSLKYCLEVILHHFRTCGILPGLVNNAVTHQFPSLLKHALVPLMDDLLRLRKYESHHMATSTRLERLEELREDLQELDIIDPEATAFRYDQASGGALQKVHSTQKWIEADKIVNWANHACSLLLEESESDDLKLCSCKFYKKEAIASLARMIAALETVTVWFPDSVTQSPVTSFTADEIRDAVTETRSRNALIIENIRKLTEEQIQSAVLAYYVAGNGVMMTLRACSRSHYAGKNISATDLQGILHRTDLSFQLGKLRKIQDKLIRYNEIKPLP